MGVDFCIRLAGSALAGGAGILFYLLILVLGSGQYIKWEKYVWIWQAVCMLISLSGFRLFKGCPIVVADYIFVGRSGEQSLWRGLTVGWFAVSVLLILYYLISYQKQYRKIICWSRENCKETISQIALETAATLQMKKLPQIRVMENMGRSPFVMGVKKELLVLSDEALSEKDIYYILRHEMIHLKRRDVWLESFFTGLCCIYWFHPLVWIMRILFRQSMELSCDAAVVKNMSYEERKEYCDILMWYAGQKSKGTHIGILEYAGEARFLKRRFSVILEEKQADHKKNAGCIVAMGIVLLLLNMGIDFQTGEKQYLYTKKNIEYGIEVYADINGDKEKERVWVRDNVRGDNAFTQISAEFENREIEFKDYLDYWSSYLAAGDLTGNGAADVVLMRVATGSTYGGGEFSVLHMGENGWEEYTDSFIPNEKIQDMQPDSFKDISCIGASIVEYRGKCLLRVIAMEDYMEGTVKCIDCSYTEEGWFIEKIEWITDYFESNLSNTASMQKNDQIDSDATINIGDVSVSLYEGEQKILRKLDKADLQYEKIKDSDTTKYDDYYNVGDETDEFIQIYFLDEECVRIRISSNEAFAHTSKGIYPRNTYPQMVEQYGNSYEKHIYMGKEIYTIYRYMLGECFHEFGIVGEATDEIYNVDVYVSSQFPIYDYGEEFIYPVDNN